MFDDNCHFSQAFLTTFKNIQDFVSCPILSENILELTRSNSVCRIAAVVETIFQRIMIIIITSIIEFHNISAYSAKWFEKFF